MRDLDRRHFLGGLAALSLLAVGCGDDRRRVIDSDDPNDVALPGLAARDASYGNQSAQVLSVWWSELTPAPRPILMWCHPGGWTQGSRFDAWTQRTVASMCPRGWAVVAIDYRLAPTFEWPAFGEDLVAAVDLTRQSARSWGLDADRLCIAGASAGGQMAAWGGSTIEGVAAVATHYGFPDLTKPTEAADDLVTKAFGPPGDPRRVDASPLLHASSAAPTLHVYGADDEFVPAAQGEAYANALDDADVPNELVVLAGAHAEVDQIPEYLLATADFLDRRVRLR